MTDAERAMWRLLREGFRDHHFRKQVPLRHFIVDFACHRLKLVIEIDGGQHGGAADDARTAIINEEGYRIIRFWNHEVLGNPAGVWTAVNAALHRHHPTPAPPHQGEGR